MAFFTAAAGFFSMIDTAAKVVTSTVDVVSGNKTFTEAAAEVVESVKSNPIVKIAANTAQVIAGEKNIRGSIRGCSGFGQKYNGWSNG